MDAIKNNSEYYTALARIETFIEKGFDKLMEEETKELAQLSEKVELYEVIKYPMPLQPTIINILENVMHEKRLNQTELSKILGIPDSTLSGILNGKKKINLNIARKLHNQLQIDGNIILEIP